MRWTHGAVAGIVASTLLHPPCPAAAQSPEAPPVRTALPASPLASPSLLALQEQSRKGDGAALGRFWEEVRRQGAPLVTFLWRETGRPATCSSSAASPKRLLWRGSRGPTSATGMPTGRPPFPTSWPSSWARQPRRDEAPRTPDRSGVQAGQLTVWPSE